MRFVNDFQYCGLLYSIWWVGFGGVVWVQRLKAGHGRPLQVSRDTDQTRFERAETNGLDALAWPLQVLAVGLKDCTSPQHVST